MRIKRIVSFNFPIASVFLEISWICNKINTLVLIKFIFELDEKRWETKKKGILTTEEGKKLFGVLKLQ